MEEEISFPIANKMIETLDTWWKNVQDIEKKFSERH